MFLWERNQSILSNIASKVIALLASPLTYHEKQGLANFFLTSQMVNTMWARWSLLQLLNSAFVSSKEPKTIHKCGCVPIKLYSQKQVVGQGSWAIVSWPLV